LVEDYLKTLKKKINLELGFRIFDIGSRESL
jgi:hypothetical protein